MSNRALVLCLGGLGLAWAATELGFWTQDPLRQITLMKTSPPSYNPYHEFNEWVNLYFYKYSGLDWLPTMIMAYFQGLGWSNAEHVSYYAICYVRDLVAGSAVYWGTAGVWHFVIYTVLGQRIFNANNRKRPTTEMIVGQMKLAQASLLIYAGLPVLSEYLIESGFTRVYFFIDEVGGWGWYAAYLVAYIAVVEIGIYWMHRTLHTNKFLYKYVHKLHHQYHTPEELSPWASIAFNPLDGILQACPYVIALFFVPCHYFTHVSLLFFSGVWATNIHDSVPGDSEPIMGAKYHTIHHTKFNYNYGQVCRTFKRLTSSWLLHSTDPLLSSRLSSLLNSLVFYILRLVLGHPQATRPRVFQRSSRAR